MLNASVGVQRVRERLRLTLPSRTAHMDIVRDLDTGTRREVREFVDSAGDRVARASAATLALRAGVAARTAAAVRGDGILPVAVAAIVLAASVLSAGPALGPGGPTGGPEGDGPAARIALGGATGAADAAVDSEQPDDGVVAADSVLAYGAADEEATITRALEGVDAWALDLVEEPESGVPPAIDGPFLVDGTLVKPIAVDTTVADGRGLLRAYTVRSGDTLVTIANRFDVSMMTIWWANSLKNKDDLHIGQKLTIPTVDGLVVVVKAGDTLASIAKANKVEADEIYSANGLQDRSLVAGQVLVLPGAMGEAIPVPKPKPTPKPTPKATTKSSSSGSSRSSGSSSGGSSGSSAPRSGGSFVWPVVGGGNYISQYFRYGHYGLDIAADYGSTVRAATGGTVTFAGWKSNGGGYQVWISHGNGLNTTYNHMAGVSVGRGQHVGRGQQVGRVGSSGWATGPHLHFEVWRGGVWNGGRRVNPLIYY